MRKKISQLLAKEQVLSQLIVDTCSPVRPFYNNLFHDRCNAIHGHPDAFNFCDGGLIFAHFAMNKKFVITRTVNGKAKDEKLMSNVKIKNKTRPKC